MSERPTPETDSVAEKINFGVDIDFARKLERERDEARKKYDTLATEHMLEVNKLCEERDEARKELEEYRSIAENIGAKKAVSEKEQAIRERDEAREQLSAAKHFLEKYIAERDEAIAEIQRLRYDAQREAEHHDRMVKELEGLYDKLKS